MMRILAILAVVVIAAPAPLILLVGHSQQQLASLTQRESLSANDFPPGNASQYRAAQKDSNDIIGNIIDAVVSEFETYHDNYSIDVKIWMYQFDSWANAENYFHSQTDYLGNEIFGVENWTRVDIQAGSGCTYFFHLYPRYDMGNGSFIPERTEFFVNLFKKDIAAVMIIDYSPLGGPHIYSQSYIEHIMQMQADKIS